MDNSRSLFNSLCTDPELLLPPEGLSPRHHSHNIDIALGFNIQRIEEALAEAESDQINETRKWIGLHPQILQTPYSQIYEFLQVIHPLIGPNFQIDQVVDLGAGYGRVGLVMSMMNFPGKFLGYEIVPSRKTEAERIYKNYGLNNCSMEITNILASDFVLPEAEVYFIYDFSNPNDLKVILEKLSEIFFEREFFIIAKGKGVTSLISHKFPKFWSAYNSYGKDDWRIYSSFSDL